MKRSGTVSARRLKYLSVIARVGSLAEAADELDTTHSNLSVQMRSLERELGAPIFERRGRRLVLTALGAEVAWYGDEVSRLVDEVGQLAQTREGPRKTPLRVGIVSTIPKALAFRLLEPALAVVGYGTIVARQDSAPRLLEELALARLHLVLTDVPPPQGGALRLFGHPLGGSDFVLYATKDLARRHGTRLPRSLEDAPFLLPMRGSPLRRSIERWLGEAGVRVRVEGEFDDVGLMRIFGLHGRGIFPVRTALAAEVEDMGGVVRVGPMPGVRERYFAISVERRVQHPAVSVLIDAARARMGSG